MDIDKSVKSSDKLHFFMNKHTHTQTPTPVIMAWPRLYTQPCGAGPTAAETVPAFNQVLLEILDSQILEIPTVLHTEVSPVY